LGPFAQISFVFLIEEVDDEKEFLGWCVDGGLVVRLRLGRQT
jgi:hypothetical protein